jgi:hypothetical protein
MMLLLSFASFFDLFWNVVLGYFQAYLIFFGGFGSFCSWFWLLFWLLMWHTFSIKVISRDLLSLFV